MQLARRAHSFSLGSLSWLVATIFLKGAKKQT